MSDHSKNLKLIFQAFIALISTFAFPIQPAFAGGVDITSYGHSALLIKGGGHSVLLNPFKSVGCAAGLIEPKVSANVILASSVLLDEGAKIAKGTFLVEPGSYRIGSLSVEGISVPHDRLGGRRYGQATLWHWMQGGLSFAHLGGAAAPLTESDKVLLGRPDVLIIGVGGGAKVYNGFEAAIIAKALKPKVIIPVQYVKDVTPENCDQKGIESFLNAMKGVKVSETSNMFTLSNKLSEDLVIKLIR